MATRASHSSPCFLRVAAASAASSASKMTSLSTPFSLETASTTIRISLFTVVRTSKCPDPGPEDHTPLIRGEPCFTNLFKRHGHLPLLFHLEHDATVIHGQQLACVAAASRARLLEFHVHP